MNAAEKYAALEAAGEEKAICKCHGVAMQWRRDPKASAGGRWQCTVTLSVFRRKYVLAGNRALCFCRRLQAGEQLQHSGHHHEGMTKWKELLGDPRPAGMTLSLICPLGPETYWGTNTRRGNPTRLSASPEDYIWESIRANTARSYGQAVLLAKAGLLDVDPDSGEVLYCETRTP